MGATIHISFGGGSFLSLPHESNCYLLFEDNTSSLVASGLLLLVLRLSCLFSRIVEQQRNPQGCGPWPVACQRWSTADGLEMTSQCSMRICEAELWPRTLASLYPWWFYEDLCQSDAAQAGRERIKHRVTAPLEGPVSFLLTKDSIMENSQKLNPTQKGAPKIAKLRYKWLNYGSW